MVLGNVPALWNSAQSTIQLGATNPAVKPWVIPIILFGGLFAAIPPVFCLAVYRNEGRLRLTKNLRLLIVCAAVVWALFVLVDLWTCVASFGAYWTSMSTLRSLGRRISSVLADPGTAKLVYFFLSEFYNLAYLALLIALSRREGDEGLVDSPISKQLKVMTKIAVVVLGIWVGFEMLRLLGTPYAFFDARDFASRLGKTPPQFWPMMTKMSRECLSQACLLAAPYVVYKGQGRIQLKASSPSPQDQYEPGGEYS